MIQVAQNFLSAILSAQKSIKKAFKKMLAPAVALQANGCCLKSIKKTQAEFEALIWNPDLVPKNLITLVLLLGDSTLKQFTTKH